MATVFGAKEHPASHNPNSETINGMPCFNPGFNLKPKTPNRHTSSVQGVLWFNVLGPPGRRNLPSSATHASFSSCSQKKPDMQAPRNVFEL